MQHFYSNLRHVFGITSVKQEIREQIDDLLSVVESQHHEVFLKEQPTPHMFMAVDILSIYNMLTIQYNITGRKEDEAERTVTTC